MLSILATLAITPFTFGHVNAPSSHAFQVRGDQLAMSLPPRTVVTDAAECRWLNQPRVYINGVRMRARWTEDRTVEHFGPVSFNGMQLVNSSRSQWANVFVHIFNACR